MLQEDGDLIIGDKMLLNLLFNFAKYSKNIANSKKGQLNRIVTWVILLLVLAVMVYFIWKYIVQKGFSGGFEPIINDTLEGSSSATEEIF